MSINKIRLTFAVLLSVNDDRVKRLIKKVENVFGMRLNAILGSFSRLSDKYCVLVAFELSPLFFTL